MYIWLAEYVKWLVRISIKVLSTQHNFQEK